MTTQSAEATADRAAAAVIEIVVSLQFQAAWIDTQRLRDAVSGVLEDAGWDQAEISVAVVDNRTIRELNRRFLQHDYDTDVLSFVLEDGGQRLEGEVIASAEMADSMANQFGWTPGDELLLYVIHGTLHLTGLDDQTEDGRGIMRLEEQRHLSRFGLRPRYEEQALDAGERPGGGPR